MKKENVYTVGTTVIIKTVTDNDLEDYLYMKRYATIFKEAYDKENGLWEYMKPRLIEDIKGNDCICLIYQRSSGCAVGYIDLELKNENRPMIGIGILENERRKGYATEAARLLVQKVLEHDEVECVEWMTTIGNEASNKIAQKLGGKLIREEPIIPIELQKELQEDEVREEMKIPCYVVYGIYRKWKF